MLTPVLYWLHVLAAVVWVGGMIFNTEALRSFCLGKHRLAHHYRGFNGVAKIFSYHRLRQYSAIQACHRSGDDFDCDVYQILPPS